MFRDRGQDGKVLSGSITVEAAVAVPVFLVALLPFLYVIRMMLAQTILEDAVTQCLKNMGTEAYVLSAFGTFEDAGMSSQGLSEESEKGISELSAMQEEGLSAFSPSVLEQAGEEAAADLAGELLLKQSLQELLCEEDLEEWGIQNGWSGVSLLGSRFFYEEEGHSGLIKACVTISWQQPFSFWTVPDSFFERKARAFTGEKYSEAQQREDEEENSGSGRTVYQMGQGTHYHTRTCYLIYKHISSLRVEQAHARGLLPCSRCGGGSSGTVYVTSGGLSYHSRSCPYLFPDLTSLTEEEALEKGLSPCGICMGEEGYFSP